jgi:hypothetical protein
MVHAVPLVRYNKGQFFSRMRNCPLSILSLQLENIHKVSLTLATRRRIYGQIRPRINPIGQAPLSYKQRTANIAAVKNGILHFCPEFSLYG